MSDVIASSCAREYQRVCVCVGPWLTMLLKLRQCVCKFASE